jgi:hypothetical protein
MPAATFHKAIAFANGAIPDWKRHQAFKSHYSRDHGL